jgi:hypothetical protein
VNQHDFVASCLVKYRLEPLPPGECWEDAHYPTPKCLKGTETVPLWSRDHSAQGLLQSEEFDHPCIHQARKENDLQNLRHHHPELLPLYDKWYTESQKRAGKRAGELSFERGTGVFGRTKEQMRETGKKVLAELLEKNPNHQHEASKASHSKKDEKGRSLCSVKGCETLHAEKNEEGKSAHAVRMGQAAAAVNHAKKDELGRSLVGVALAANTNSQRWEDPDHPELGVSNPGLLARRQRLRGYPHGKENRRRVG